MTSKESSSPFSVNSIEDLQEGDYVSPGLQLIKVDACFPNMKVGDIDSIPNIMFRKHIRHTWYIDSHFPACGFLSRDEAHILYNNALQFKGKRCLEIGSHTGWSTVHLALAGISLDVIEPQLSMDPRTLISIIDSLRRAKVQQSVQLIPGYSPAAVHQLALKLISPEAPEKTGLWSLIFIDGNHEGSGPLDDAQVAEKYAAEDCMIVFHDLAFPDVASGFAHFLTKEDGWNTKIYHTQQIIGIAWRGHVTPVAHIPDTKYDWTNPPHLEQLISKSKNLVP